MLEKFILIKTKFINFVLKRVALYSNKLEFFDTPTGKQDGSSSNDIFVLFLSRRLYKEHTKAFPISERKSLKKVISHESSYDSSLILGSDGRESYVCFWQYDNSLIRDAFIIIPETFVLFKELPKNVVFEIEDKQGNYFYVSNSKGSYSGFKSNLVSNTQQFALAAGVAIEGERFLSEEQKRTLLKGAISKRYIYDSWYFYNRKKIKKLLTLRPKEWAVLLAIPFVYLIITSSYLFLKGVYLEHRLSGYQADTSSLLNKKRELESKVEFINLTSSFSNNEKTTRAWEVLKPLYEMKVSISNLRFKDKLIQVTGHAENATNVIQKLSEDGNIRNVELKGDIRTTYSGERFTVQFTYE